MTISSAFCHEAFELEFGIVAKVDQEPELKPCGFEIILDLSPMFVRQWTHSLQLKNDLVVANEVWLVPGLKRARGIRGNECG
jgi:hypothetical protein